MVGAVVGAEMADRRTGPRVVRIALVVDVTVVGNEEEPMSDKNSGHCLVRTALVGVVAAAVVAVLEIETVVTEAAVLKGANTVHCLVHTELAPVYADIHPHKRSHIAGLSGARS